MTQVDVLSNIERVAFNASIALSILVAHQATKPEEERENLRIGIRLIELFNTAKEGYSHKDEMTLAQEDAIYRIRGVFFVERVKGGDLGFTEWNGAVVAELKSFIDKVVDGGAEVKPALEAFLNGEQLLSATVDMCCNFFRFIDRSAKNPK